MVKFKSSDLPYKKAVIDTGPLFSVLTFEFVRQQREFRNTVIEKHDPPPYALMRERDYLDFFGSINQIFFTSHVIGELKSRHKLPTDIYRQFWMCSMDYLKRKQVDEQLLRLLSMSDDLFTSGLVCSVGPVDAGLVTLARRENCVLLTDDRRLLSCRDNAGKPEIELMENVIPPPHRPG